MDVYIINKTSSEGFLYGNESYPFVSTDMDQCIKEAYTGMCGYEEAYRLNHERLDPEEEFLDFERFSKIMESGFEYGYENGEGYVVIQCDDCHIQFEPHVCDIESETIYCHDCAFKNKRELDGKKRLYCKKLMAIVKPNDSCSWGERIENE